MQLFKPLRCLLLIATVLLNTSCSSARESNEIPLYGTDKGRTPTALEKKADEQFFADIAKTGMSRKDAANHFCQRGWEQIQSKKPLIAIRRFNQAWLLDPKNANAYWGLGAAQSELGEFSDSIHLLTIAHKMSNDSDVLGDMGLVYANWGKKASNAAERQKLDTQAQNCYAEAIRLNPKCEGAYANWSMLLASHGQYKQAWQMVRNSQRLGGGSLNPEFVKHLTRLSPPN